MVESRHKRTKSKCRFFTKRDLVCVLGRSAEDAKKKKKPGRVGEMKRGNWEEYGVKPQSAPEPNPPKASTRTL